MVAAYAATQVWEVDFTRFCRLGETVLQGQNIAGVPEGQEEGGETV